MTDDRLKNLRERVAASEARWTTEPTGNVARDPNAPQAKVATLPYPWTSIRYDVVR